MKTKVITLEVLESDSNTMGSVILTNSKGDTFEILHSHRNEELLDFIKRSELKSKEMEMITLIKDIYDEYDYMSWNWMQIQDRCYKVLRYFNLVREAGTPSTLITDERKQNSVGKKYLIMVLKALNLNISTFVALAGNVPSIADSAGITALKFN